MTRFSLNGEVTGDEEGRFRLPASKAGTRLLVRAAGLAPARVQVTAEAIRKGVLPDLVLDEGREVGGEVFDADTREPISGASITLADPDEVRNLVSSDFTRIVDPVVSVAAGAFVLSHAPRGEWLLVVHHASYVPELAILSGSEPVKVLLRKGGWIQGTTRGRAAEPLPHRQIVALSGSSIDAREAVTDGAGLFRMGPLRAGRYLVLPTPAADGVEEKEALLPVAIEVVDGRTESVHFQARSLGATVRVSAVDARGKPAAAGALLVAGEVPHPGSLSNLLESGSLFPSRGKGGVQIIPGVPRGAYTLFVLQERAGRPPGIHQQSVQVSEEDLAVEVKLPEDLPALAAPVQVRFGTLSPL